MANQRIILTNPIDEAAVDVLGNLADVHGTCGAAAGTGDMMVSVQRGRRCRFEHVNLPASIRHPFGSPGDTVKAFPVLPAAFFQSPAGADLADLYDNMVAAKDTEDVERITLAVQQVCESLVPIVVEAHSWNLQEAETLARGLALEPRAADAADNRCEGCGYPLDGLDVTACPGCGRPIKRPQ